MTVDPTDPLARVTAPPPGETPEQREERIKAEQAAKAHSDRIDEALAKSAAHEKRRRKANKLLLLGQADSGKSTVLKSA
jgi:tRNA U34 5-carboxymethylaminomethyl modifying GTPase MnmE/TrmE